MDTHQYPRAYTLGTLEHTLAYTPNTLGYPSNTHAVRARIPIAGIRLPRLENRDVCDAMLAASRAVRSEFHYGTTKSLRFSVTQSTEKINIHPLF